MTYAVAAATAVTLLLAGCNGGDKDPTPTATASASSTASTTSTSSPSPTSTTSVQLPAAARAQTDAGAVAFARFYILEVDRAYVTLDNSAITAYAQRSCTNCQTAANTVEAAKSDGQRQPRPSFTITGAQTQPFPDRTVVDVYVDVADVPSVNAKGETVSPGEPGKDSFRVDLVWENGWKVKAVGPR
ncbi:DUF6318 family protein [Knoellia sp. CPCC 206453]|uniref:DUF6318 family protein n=1 Tax=Knoellia pratensis TaxID=3404796 RepID=UPI00360990B8